MTVERQEILSLLSSEWMSTFDVVRRVFPSIKKDDLSCTPEYAHVGNLLRSLEREGLVTSMKGRRKKYWKKMPYKPITKIEAKCPYCGEPCIFDEDISIQYGSWVTMRYQWCNKCKSPFDLEVKYTQPTPLIRAFRLKVTKASFPSVKEN